jgi:ribose 5-phosphate isomerase B|uniref:Ribose 5-phosphate isomerase B n=1 Tax=candidate division WOR-3 bacterium TaxID=2052148 RepID=A0A7C6ECN6_UNCW3
MKIGIGSDHRGFELKEFLKPILQNDGYKVKDFGVFSPAAADYPDIAFALTNALSSKAISRGILICGSGLGMSIAANKAKGIRACLCLNEKMAKMARNHNDSNVLVLAANFTTKAKAHKILRVWLQEKFEGGRHRRRIKKIEEYCLSPIRVKQ